MVLCGTTLHNTGHIPATFQQRSVLLGIVSRSFIQRLPALQETVINTSERNKMLKRVEQSQSSNVSQANGIQ